MIRADIIEGLEFIQDENLLPFEANIALQILQKDSSIVCSYLVQKRDFIDEKTWISSLKHLPYDAEILRNSGIFETCEHLAVKGYKLIPSMIQLKWNELSLALWKVILHKHLGSFLPSVDDYNDCPSKVGCPRFLGMLKINSQPR